MPPRSVPDPRQLDPARAAVMLGRALRRRCPHCGAGPLFSRWVVMRRTCPGCHLVLDRREPDYFLGGYVINFVAAELMVAVGALVAIVATWPDVPWSWIQWGLIALMIPVPVLTYPLAKTLWLALDLVFRPVTLADLAGHGENLEDDADRAAGPRVG